VNAARRSLRACAVAAAVTGCSVQVTNSESGRSPAPPARAVPHHVESDGAFSPAEETDEQAWKAIAAALGRPGELKDAVYRVVFLRDDLDVTVEGNDVPTAAGLASEFHFYRCPCGRINVVGQFVVADYEANDVIDALRGGAIEVASVGPLLLHEKPRLLLIRFFGENRSGGALAKTLRTALSWTGKERMAPQKTD
jgi:hypothetical protein